MPNEPEDGKGTKPLDGGWGWMVVIGAHISIGFSYSTPKVMSIFYTYMTEDMGVDLNEVAWVTSIMLATMYAGGEFIDGIMRTGHCYQGNPCGQISTIESVKVRNILLLLIVMLLVIFITRMVSFSVYTYSCGNYRVLTPSYVFCFHDCNYTESVR